MYRSLIVRKIAAYTVSSHWHKGKEAVRSRPITHFLASFLVDEDDKDEDDNFNDDADERPDCSVATLHSNEKLWENKWNRLKIKS